MRKKGYKEQEEHIVIEGIPVQFIPAYNALVEKAIDEAVKVEYKGVKTNRDPLPGEYPGMARIAGKVEQVQEAVQ